LRYLRNEPSLRATTNCSVAFNYLGQFDRPTGGLLRQLGAPIRTVLGPTILPHDVVVNVWRTAGKFWFQVGGKGPTSEDRIVAIRNGMDVFLKRVTAFDAAGDSILSSERQLFWLGRTSPALGVLNMMLSYRIRGALEPERLKMAIDAFARRHEAMRTGFATVRGRPRRVVFETPRVRFRRSSVRMGPSGRAKYCATASEELRKADLRASGLNFDATLVSFDERDHLLVVVIDHMIWDAWSTRVFCDEVSAIYADDALLLSPPVQMRELVTIRSNPARDRASRVKASWLQTLDETSWCFELPGCTGQSGGRLITISAPLSEAGTAGVLRATRITECTPFLLMAYGATRTLATLLDRTKVTLPCPVAHRGQLWTRSVVGLVSDMFPLTVDTRLDRASAIADVVSQLRRTESDPLPITELMPRHGLPRFRFLLQPGTDEACPNLRDCTVEEVRVATSNLGPTFTLALKSSGDGFTLFAQYDEAAYKRASAVAVLSAMALEMVKASEEIALAEGIQSRP
jgi:hypothetical protein